MANPMSNKVPSSITSNPEDLVYTPNYSFATIDDSTNDINQNSLQTPYQSDENHKLQQQRKVQTKRELMKKLVLFAIPKEDFNAWPSNLIVVSDMTNKDVRGQSTNLRVAVRQGILTRLQKQPSIITSANKEETAIFSKYFPSRGFDKFIYSIRRHFRAITAPVELPTAHKFTNSPYAGYLLELATDEERTNFDLNHARENAEVSKRIFPHGKPMFSADLKSYVNDRKDELESFMNRLFKSNKRYSNVDKWIPKLIPNAEKRIKPRARSSIRKEALKSNLARNHAAGSSSTLTSSVGATPHNLQVNWSNESIAVAKNFTIQNVKEYINVLKVGDLEKQKMLDIEMNGEVLTSIIEAADLETYYKLTPMEALKVIEAMNLTSFA